MKGSQSTANLQRCYQSLREQRPRGSLCPHLQGRLRPRRAFSTTRNLAIIQPDTDKHDPRERVVVLGSGWAGFVFAKNLDPKKYRITVISPRTYFVFTPLLTDTAVGTLEFRNVLESIRRSNSIEYIQAWANDVNFVAKTVDVEPAVLDPSQSFALTGREGHVAVNTFAPSDDAYLADNTASSVTNHIPTFPVKYDRLVVTVGSYSQTFNTPGVRENAYFLKDVGDARNIRKRVLELFELCQMPFLSDETRRHLLHFCIVGAGPTGMEFAGNLGDLIGQDMAKMHPELMKFVKITMYDVAPKILPMFDAALAEYAEKQYRRHNIDIKTSHHVELLRKGPPGLKEAEETQSQLPGGRVYTLKTTEGGEVGCGMCVWSTGLMANPFIEKALNHVRRFPGESAEVFEGSPVDKSRPREWIIQRNPKTGSMIVDDHFRVRLVTEKETSRAVMNDVFALGDCTHLAGVDPPLPATAQVANQEAQFLAKAFNKSGGNGLDIQKLTTSKGFSFHNRGVMTFLGGAKAVLQGPNTSREGAARGLKGWLAYLIWRGAYLTMTLSWRNKFLIPVQWLAVKVFGRSISRF